MSNRLILNIAVANSMTRVIGTGLVLILGIAAQPALAAHPSYGIALIGLYDPTHTRDGSQYGNNPRALNGSGQVVGYAPRYDSASTELGTSAWFFDGIATQIIGLTDVEHTRSDGFQGNSLRNDGGLNTAGQVVGSADRFDGMLDMGLSTWLFSGGTTQEIGLMDAEHTRSDGYRFNYPNEINQAGQVGGWADLYNGAEWIGTSTWLYGHGAIQEIGLLGAGFISSDGHRSNQFAGMNEAGKVIGYAGRYDGARDTGVAAWLFDGSSAQQIGLTDTEHTRSDGFQWNNPFYLNNAGQVAGQALRYSGAEASGRSAWLYDHGTTHEIGLFGSGYARSDGYQFNYVTGLNETGKATGRTDRFDGATTMGSSVWLFDGSDSQEIGLRDMEHTRSDGYRINRSYQTINDAGQVAGQADRYSGVEAMGQSAWLYNHGTTHKIGLTDAAHTKSDGFQYNEVNRINAAGQVAGNARRFVDGNGMGTTAWFYDDDLDQTFAFDFSISSAGYGSSTIYYLGDDCLVLGSYNLYDGYRTVGLRAFAWNLLDGFLDLGSLIDGTEDINWLALYDAVKGNELGQIIGSGGLANGMNGVSGGAAYLLTPKGVPKASIGVWRPSTRKFLLDSNASNTWDGATGGDTQTGAFGLSTDIPVTGDWNGDGTDEVGYWRPSTRTFSLDANGNGKWDGAAGGDTVTSAFGAATDVPVTGDWNGDGTDEVGYWRPSTRKFYLDANGNDRWDGTAGGDTLTTSFGLSTDIPVTGDWNGDGKDEVGVWRPGTRRFLLDSNANNTWDGAAGGDTLTTSFGLSTDIPVTGRW